MARPTNEQAFNYVARVMERVDDAPTGGVLRANLNTGRILKCLLPSSVSLIGMNEGSTTQTLQGDGNIIAYRNASSGEVTFPQQDDKITTSARGLDLYEVRLRQLSGHAALQLRASNKKTPIFVPSGLVKNN